MVSHLPPSRNVPGRPHWWRSLQLWQRVLVIGVLLGALAIAAGLIYYGPRLQVAAPARHTALAATPTPGYATPPGNDLWYYWGQSQPLNQQP